MVTKLSHTSIYVNDQDKAYDFYVNKLGFKVNTDAKMENGFRWLTVNPPEQPDLEVVLFPATSDVNGFDQDVRDAMKLLLELQRTFLLVALPGLIVAVICWVPFIAILATVGLTLTPVTAILLMVPPASKISLSTLD